MPKFVQLLLGDGSLEASYPVVEQICVKTLLCFVALAFVRAVVVPGAKCFVVIDEPWQGAKLFVLLRSPVVVEPGLLVAMELGPEAADSGFLAVPHFLDEVGLVPLLELCFFDE